MATSSGYHPDPPSATLCLRCGALATEHILDSIDWPTKQPVPLPVCAECLDAFWGLPDEHQERRFISALRDAKRRAEAPTPPIPPVPGIPMARASGGSRRKGRR